MAQHFVLLLTDIVDSTALTERLGNEQAASVFAMHDGVARRLLATWNGREIDKSDGLLALFTTAAEATSYALAYHRALAVLPTPLSARVALHAGTVQVRTADADELARGHKPVEVDGLAKPMVARLAALALPGQTLLTRYVAPLVGQDGYAVRSLGHWQLKGIEHPIEVFGLEGGCVDVPPDVAKARRVVEVNGLWLPAGDVANSLPAERDAFVGRSEPLDALESSLAGTARLVTLLGIGGSGKTRLAQRYGWERLGDFPGGVWFCDLVQATSLSGLFHCVALGLRFGLGRGDPAEQIAHAIAGRGRCLLILDNFEQVVREAEATVGRWLQSAPLARFIVTSREVLGIVGEKSLQLPPMRAAEGVALFTRRAEAVSGWKPARDEEAALCTLVDLLDGLPLAIELAASRISVLSPKKMLERVGERFKLLASSGGRIGRQATMRGALDWSWDLISEVEQAALAQISLFQGGFTLEAAESILQLSVVGNVPWTPDVIQALVQKSLVRAAAQDRFELLRTVQEYASEKLSLQEREMTLERHSLYYGHHRVSNDHDGEDADLDNFILASRSALRRMEGETSLRALRSAWEILKRVGPFDVAGDLARALRAILPAEAQAASLASLIEGGAKHAQGQVGEAAAALKAGLRNDKLPAELSCELHASLGASLSAAGFMDEAGSHIEHAVALASTVADGHLKCQVLNERGAWLMRQSRLADARGCYAQAHVIACDVKDQRWQGGLSGNLGMIEQMLGNVESALQHYERALALAHLSSDRTWEGNTRCNLGLLHQEQGREEKATEEFKAALRIARHLGHRRLESTVLCNMGLLLDFQRKHAAAAEQHRAASAVARQTGDARAEGQCRSYLGLSLARIGEHSQAAEAFAAAEALLDALGDSISMGLLRCAQAEAAIESGDTSAAATAFDSAVAYFRIDDPGEASELGRALQRLRQRLAGPS